MRLVQSVDPAGALREAVEVIGGRRALVCLLAVLAFGAAVIAGYPAQDWDYRCYVNAARLIEMGRSPYSGELGTQYLYPPPMAHLFVALRRVLPGDDAVFLLYSGVQICLLAGAYVLMVLLLRRLNVGARTASALGAALLIVNAPVFYTLRHDNTNLALLDAALVAMLYPRAAVSGLLLAAATLLKLYPAFLLVPLWFFGYRKIALWWAIGVLLPFAASGPRHDLPAFIEILPNMPKGEAVLDNSVSSLVERGFRMAGAAQPRLVVSAIAGVAGVAAVALVTWRLHKGIPFLRACAEWTAVVLLLSPIAWPEHFVIVLPLIAIALSGGPHRMLLGVAVLLVMVLPRTPIYPISHHFLFGLALLMLLPVVYSGGAPVDDARGVQSSHR